MINKLFFIELRRNVLRKKIKLIRDDWKFFYSTQNIVVNFMFAITFWHALWWNHKGMSYTVESLMRKEICSSIMFHFHHVPSFLFKFSFCLASNALLNVSGWRWDLKLWEFSLPLWGSLSHFKRWKSFRSLNWFRPSSDLCELATIQYLLVWILRRRKNSLTQQLKYSRFM